MRLIPRIIQRLKWAYESDSEWAERVAFREAVSWAREQEEEGKDLNHLRAYDDGHHDGLAYAADKIESLKRKVSDLRAVLDGGGFRNWGEKAKAYRTIQAHRRQLDILHVEIRRLTKQRDQLRRTLEDRGGSNAN